MNYDLTQSIEVLQATPSVLQAMLGNLAPAWTTANEGADTWSAYDIIGHLIHAEKTDWIPRMKIILSTAGNIAFETFDRFAQFNESKGKTLQQLLKEFSELRQSNIQYIVSLDLTAEDLRKTGMHPAFGKVNLSQMLSTWTVHDLNHIAQIARVMAKQYKEEVGPWVEYLGILQR